MIHITRFDGFDQLARNERFRDLDEMFTRLALRPVVRDPAEISLDVAEGEAAYTVAAELPGAKREDIEVAIDGRHISIQAEIRREGGDGGMLLRAERRVGRRSRSFDLPEDIDETLAQAEYRDGVLQLVLPIKRSAEAKKLAVK